MDVMVFCPVYRLEPETVQALCALRWDDPLTVVWQRDNPAQTGDERADGWANHLHQYQRGYETFMAGRFDAMLVIESDIIPPEDTLERLAALPCDVAYGAYVFRHLCVPPRIRRHRERAPAVSCLAETSAQHGRELVETAQPLERGAGPGCDRLLRLRPGLRADPAARAGAGAV